MNLIAAKFQALYFSLFKHTVLIVDENTGESGSGVFVSTTRYSFVITAHHVSEIENKDNIYIDLGLVLKEKIRIEDIVYDKELDFACLLIDSLDAKYRIGRNKEPFHIGKPLRLGALPSLPRFALVGFPSSTSKLCGKLRESNSMFTLDLRLMPPNVWPESALEEGKKKETNFLVPYGEKHGMHFKDYKGDDTDPCEPAGFSGCGLWAYDDSRVDDQDGWYALSAIQTGYYRQSQCLVLTQMGPILESLTQKYGNLF
jgi:hypothetical protein